ncbi:PE-PPE domain-containing protein [Mycolicibacterium sphagni]|uniref:PE-PPE domain-containing protein n=1 Tax=Mycolicibacterium sphagni TaxID=1786 RepID=UPI0021F2931B|nr:PE-PPE domain-containing protein [Mycolicibacterium sphagni]MCV7179372.1 PE-PPE domain-containing protein [Mycolicibacterium sphagni]
MPASTTGARTAAAPRATAGAKSAVTVQVPTLKLPAPPRLKIPTPPTPNLPALPSDSDLELALAAFSRRITESPPLTAAAATVTTVLDQVQAAAAQNTALIMGGSGDPIPSPTYIQHVFDLYINPSYPGAVPFQLDTPEGLYPITGVKSLPLNVSVQQGISTLMTTIASQIDAGNTATVFGYSQSAIISSLVQSLLPAGTAAQFVLVGNEMNPNGGFLSRFPNLSLPSLGIDFYGATPENLFPTTNYTLEYDGFADFPKYPLNFLADLNAGLGIVFVHTKYADLTSAQVDSAIALPTTDPSQKYYVIPTENLPLLEPLRLIPVIGNPIADLLQPALKVIVNLGYGDPNYGWSTDGYANVQSTFGFIPNVNWGEVAQLFVAGVQQGINDFVADVSPGGIMWQELAALHLPKPGPSPVLPTPTGVISALQTVISDVAYNVSNSSAALYAAALPTADIVNAIVTMLPAYDANLFLSGIQQALSGDAITGLVNAIGLPLAASVGLGTTAALIEVLVLVQAAQGFFGQETDV